MNHLLRSLLRFARTLKGIIALGTTSFLLIIGIATTKATAQSTSELQISPTAAAQIQALIQEKDQLTSAERKIHSQLRYTIKKKRRDALISRVPELATSVQVLSGDKVRVDIDTEPGKLTPQLLKTIQETYGSQILSSFPKYNTLQVIASLDQINAIAALPEVRSIRQYIPPIHGSGISPTQLESQTVGDSSQANPAVSQTEQLLAQAQTEASPQVGKVTSEGDIAQGAALARYIYRVNGSWLQRNPTGGLPTRQRVKVGILSDSYNKLGGAATDIARGDLPSDGVTLVGTGDSDGEDEGRAMLQIVHDLAPGAKLYFATANGGEATFANNILALRAAGCDIIVDDVSYFHESVFQDGIVAQAVNAVTANGALYFSSAGNSGNLKDGTAGVWEGNFVDGGPVSYNGVPLGRIHRFASGSFGLSDPITKKTGSIFLQWADPYGRSSNDYDLYVLNASGTAVVAASTNTQDGNDDPFEIVPAQPAGNRAVVVLRRGSPRYLHLNSNRGQLGFATRGQTSGHSAAVNAFSVAAVSAEKRRTLFTGANRVENFSSDGPRRIFFNPNGTPITWLGGGIVRQKPDIAAADGVVTTLPPGGLNPFFGTSAAAPHAGAVAALLKSFKPNLSSSQIRSILTSTALDIEGRGVDENSGAGIVMANLALRKAALTP